LAAPFSFAALINAPQVLARLDKSDADDPEFEKLLGQFITAGREHIAFEETRVWPGLRSALISTEAEESGDKLEQAKKTAPTRPHPTTRDTVVSGTSGVGGTISSKASAARDTLASTASSAADVASSAPNMARRRTQGNPLAAGLIAFGAG
jgi:hypothetical protein